MGPENEADLLPLVTGFTRICKAFYSPYKPSWCHA